MALRASKTASEQLSRVRVGLPPMNTHSSLRRHINTTGSQYIDFSLPGEHASQLFRFITSGYGACRAILIEVVIPGEDLGVLPCLSRRQQLLLHEVASYILQTEPDPCTGLYRCTDVMQIHAALIYIFCHFYRFSTASYEAHYSFEHGLLSEYDDFTSGTIVISLRT